MFICSPYETTYGKLLNSETIIKALIRYLAGTKSTNLNYEYDPKSDIGLVFITGFDNDEQELPAWDHPVIFKDHRGNTIIASDLRKYVKVIKGQQPLTITEITKDKSNIDFIILRTLVTADFSMGYFGNFRNEFKSVISGFSLIMSNIINSLVIMNPVEKVNVEIVLAYYVNVLLTNSDVSDMKPVIKARILSSKLSIPLTNKAIDNIVDILDPEFRDINSLMNNIKLALPEEKAKLINTSVIVNGMSSMWYGPGGSEAMVMSVEHLPTWIALMYVNINDNTFKRSRLAMMLEKHNKNIKNTEFSKAIELYIKEHTL